MNSAALIASNPELNQLAWILVTQYPYFTAFMLGCLTAVAVKSWLNI